MFIRQKGKYKESAIHWILLMNIHIIFFWMV